MIAPDWRSCSVSHSAESSSGLVGNRPFGDRFAHLVGLERYKAACALLLLAPYVPLLFMGDEFAASTPFLFFTDHEAALGERIAAGRRVEFKHFYSGKEAEAPDPQADAAFAKSKLDLSERDKPPHDGVYRLFQELLRLRHDDPVLRRQDRSRMRAEAPMPRFVALMRWNENEERRLLLVNFGDGARFDAGDHAWLGEAGWQPLLSTAEERFAGPGVDLGKLAFPSGTAVDLPPTSAVLWAAEGT